MRASDVMSAPVHVVGPTDSAAHARNQMIRHRCSRLPVVDGDRLVGIITKKDLGYRLRQAEPSWRRRPIDRVPASLLMTPDPVSVAADASTRTVAAAMIEYGVSGLPVVEDCALVGILTKTDLLGSVSVERLEGTVGDLMGDVVTISRYHSLDHAIDLASERDRQLVVVNNDGTLAGIITESNLAFFEYVGRVPGEPDRDVTMLRREDPGGPKTLRYVRDVSAVAEDLMTRPVETASPGDSIGDAVRRMREMGINSLVVVDDGDIKGIITRDDIIKGVAT
jgi:CBS domain-containing protein